jgi:hypothetical protein
MPTDVSTPLPQLDLSEGTTVTVTLDDPNGVITSLTLHGWQEMPGEPPPEGEGPLWLPVPVEAG